MNNQSHKNIRAVLFDLDGVLLDSESIYTDFWNNVESIFPTGVPNFAIVIKGTTLGEILDTYFPDPARQAEIHKLLKRQEEEMVYRLFDGILPMLRSLRSRDIRTAIVTSSSNRKMDDMFRTLPDLKPLIDTIVTEDDVTESKPSPQGYLLAAKRLGALDGEFAVVEDSIKGLQAGRASGAFVVGISTTNPAEKISPLADMVLPTAAELADNI